MIKRILTGLAAILPLAGACSGGAGKEVCDAGNVAGIEERVEKYALLISGLTESRHIENMSSSYNLLLAHGFKRENIIVLDKEGQERCYNLPEPVYLPPLQEEIPSGWHCFYPVDGAASRETIKEAFASLKQRVDSNDLLFVYVSDHGTMETDKIKMISVISLPDETISDVEFAQYTQGISPGFGLFIFDHCYSGAFAKSLGNDSITAVSASGVETAFNMAGQASAGIEFMLAFDDKVTADVNNDGRVSLQEAFDYMLVNHEPTIEGLQHPAIYSNMDTEHIFFFD